MADGVVDEAHIVGQTCVLVLALVPTFEGLRKKVNTFETVGLYVLNNHRLIDERLRYLLGGHLVVVAQIELMTFENGVFSGLGEQKC
jgi:hypothetical protein